ncbi:hypothetical protein BDZ88DRAFT_456575 [Geranomyces variabilis]|nr:hypothetical protein BDZ88DRAFT_456575 [Geranomyces variabilis]
MATFTPPALPAGHWAAAAGAAAKIVFLYDGIPDVEKVHEWGEAHAAHHNALQRADTDMGSGSFTTYDYMAYQDYIQSFQRLLQQEDMAVQINSDLMERSSTLAKQTQWLRDVNGGHTTMDQIYNAARTALSASGISDGAATGQMPIAPVPQQRPAPVPPYTKTHANVAFSDSTLPTWYSSEDAVAPSYLSPNPYSKAAASTPYACKDSPDASYNTSTSCPNSAATSWTKNAKKTVDGESLETANMAYSVGQSVNNEQDLMDVPHDYDQYDAQCQDDKDSNYMAEAMREIEQEDFLSTWQ